MKRVIAIDLGTNYLKQKLEWVKHEMEAIDQIEARLREMRKLAERARDGGQTPAETREANTKLRNCSRK